MNIYFACAMLGILGMFLTQIIIYGRQKKKYENAKLIWDPKIYWKGDFLMQIAGTIVCISMGLIMLYFTFLQYPKYKDMPLQISVFFAFLGYGGTDVATKLFSAVNKRYTNAVGYKADISGEATGTFSEPTPAAKPVKP